MHLPHNKQLQEIRGHVCFRTEESLARRPRTLVALGCLQLTSHPRSTVEPHEVAGRLRDLYSAAERARQNENDIEIRAHSDYSSRPVEKRPEAGFSIWIPQSGDEGYAGVRIMPAEGGVTTHGEAGRRWSGGEYHLFSWPSVQIEESGFVVEGQAFKGVDEAVQRIIRSLREKRASVRRQ